MSSTISKRQITLFALAILAVAIITALVTALAMNITGRKVEAEQTFTKVVDLDETTVDPAIWGRNFPAQYQTFKQTAQAVPTVHGGNEIVDKEKTEKDPRTKIAPSHLTDDPRLKEMWAGYAFATDYRFPRGHAYMLQDQRLTLRTQDFPQPGTCLNCHASMPEVYSKLGHGDQNKGFDAVNSMTYKEATSHAKRPIACADCHDPKTMQLRVTRPAFINGIKALKKHEGVKNFDPNKDATNQEMRTYICAQCHVEYYFKDEGDGRKTLTFPWDNGTHIDQIYKYYEDRNFVDWTHKKTGQKMLKAQHPEFDIWSNGIHAKNGVSCADCHMPYERQGAHKVSNHSLKSPLLDANKSCATCHAGNADTVKKAVVRQQDSFIGSRDRAMDSLVTLIHGMEKLKAEDPKSPQLALAGKYQRKASFYLDYIYSENSHGAHAPDYAQEILNKSLDASRKGQLALNGASESDLAASEVAQRHSKEIANRK